jgi:hypothetical protein
MFDAYRNHVLTQGCARLANEWLGFTQFTLGVNGPEWRLGPEVEKWLAWGDEQNA